MADMFSFSFKGFVQHPILAHKVNKAMHEAQKFIDTECLKLCAEKVPKETGALIKSSEIHTTIGSGLIKYRTPYARRWYYMPANFQEGSGGGKETVGRGNYWFERMKIENRKKILEGAQNIINQNL